MATASFGHDHRLGVFHVRGGYGGGLNALDGLPAVCAIADALPRRGFGDALSRISGGNGANPVGGGGAGHLCWRLRADQGFIGASGLYGDAVFVIRPWGVQTAGADHGGLAVDAGGLGVDRRGALVAGQSLALSQRLSRRVDDPPLVSGVWRFGDVLITTLTLGMVASGLAVVLAMIWLSRHSSKSASMAEKWFYLPLLLPQAGFLFGVQVMLLWMGLDGTWLALIWAHLLFVLPYVWLSLAPSWRSFNTQWLVLAASLGASPWRRFYRVQLPILLLPVLTSFAVGFSVSAALYLPTVFASNGRITTLTVEAVTLAEGSSRSQLGVATGLQMALPLVIFLLATVLARYRYRRFSYFS